MDGVKIQEVVQAAIQEFIRQEQSKSEPAYKAELLEERQRREALEKRLNDLAEEAKQSRARAEEAERGAAIRSELQRLGVAKLDLAFKAVQDSVVRSGEGQYVARTNNGEAGLKEYLTGFLSENPEFLPARIAGGSGMTATQKAPPAGREGVDLERIRPGMSKEEMERAREEILRVASQSLR